MLVLWDTKTCSCHTFKPPSINKEHAQKTLLISRTSPLNCLAIGKRFCGDEATPPRDTQVVNIARNERTKDRR